MKNQLNFEVVSDKELMTINGGQNMSMTDGGFEGFSWEHGFVSYKIG